MLLKKKKITATLLCLGIILLYAFSFHSPVFFQDKTISSFDFCYFSSPAYKSLKPDSLKRASNALLMDVALVMQPWDLAMMTDKISYPWLWNPFSGCGAPMLAAAQSAVFYPLKHLSFLLGGISGFGVLCFFKMSFAGIFMWLYLRNLGLLKLSSLFGALSFMASGFMIVWLQFPIVAAALFFPLILLACDYLLATKYRPGFIILTTSVFFSFLGGHPETTLILVVTAGFYLGGRYLLTANLATCLFDKSTWTTLIVFSGAVIVGCIMAAVQIVPTIEYILNSTKLLHRATAASHVLSWDSVWTMGWDYAYRELLSYILPDAWGNPSRIPNWWNRHSNYNESAGYAGIGVIWLALVAWGGIFKDKRVRVFCFLQVISLAFILQFAWFNNVVDNIPVLNLCANKRFLLVFCFSNAVLAALVLDRFQKEKSLFGTWEVIWMFLITACLTGVVFYDYFGRFAPDSHDWIVAYGRKQIVHFLIFLFPFLLIVFGTRFNPLKKRILAIVFVLFLAVDLFITYYKYNPIIDSSLLYPETKAIQFLQSVPKHKRVLPVGLQTIPNTSVAYGIEDPRIYDALIILSYGKFLDNLGANSSLWNTVDKPNMRMSSLASVRYLWGDSSWQPDEPNLVLCYEDSTSRIYENKNALPHAFLSQQWETVPDTDQAFQKLSSPAFSWKKKVVVETSMAGGEIEGSQSDGKSFFSEAHISEYNPMRVVIDLPQEQMDNGGLLVLNDSYYPGWVASVDGVSATVYRVNGTFRGVRVKGDNRQVVFEYKPYSFLAGAILSLLGCLGFIIFLVNGFKKV